MNLKNIVVRPADRYLQLPNGHSLLISQRLAALRLNFKKVGNNILVLRVQSSLQLSTDQIGKRLLFDTTELNSTQLGNLRKLGEDARVKDVLPALWPSAHWSKATAEEEKQYRAYIKERDLLIAKELQKEKDRRLKALRSRLDEAKRTVASVTKTLQRLENVEEQNKAGGVKCPQQPA